MPSGLLKSAVSMSAVLVLAPVLVAQSGQSADESSVAPAPKRTIAGVSWGILVIGAASGGACSTAQAARPRAESASGVRFGKERGYTGRHAP